MFVVKVTVESEYLLEQSDPSISRYVFAYHVTLQNRSEMSVQLLTRHWQITNGNGETEEVHGEGVVGMQPHLQPAEIFRYSSGCVLATPVGSMRGSYTFVSHGSDVFDAPIAPFTLAMPKLLH
jgi:ApaG protein